MSVGPTKKSMAAICFAWSRRKLVQIWEEECRGLGRYLRTVEWETTIPNLAGSSRMRGPPQVGFDWHIRRINWRTSGSMRGRSPRERGFQRQHLWNSARCQAVHRAHTRKTKVRFPALETCEYRQRHRPSRFGVQGWVPSFARCRRWAFGHRGGATGKLILPDVERQNLSIPCKVFPPCQRPIRYSEVKRETVEIRG